MLLHDLADAIRKFGRIAADHERLVQRASISRPGDPARLAGR